MELHELSTPTTDPRERGQEVGTRFPEQVRTICARYLAHFDALGIERALVREIADNSARALRDWAPSLAAESEGMAEGAGVERWMLAAVGARTEVLAGTKLPGECTTAVRVPGGGGAPETIQTWDWHEDLTPEGLLLSLSTPTGRRVKLFTEFGTAAKIGVNDAGLGMHFNILRHQSDHTSGGVPVHAIARRVLEEATTVAEACDIVASARVSASSVLTVTSYAPDPTNGIAEAASIEISPAGVAEVRPGDDGWLIHTNHFLDPQLAEGDRSTPESLSVERFDHAWGVRAGMTSRSAADRAAAFCGSAGAEAVVCMRPDTSQPVHEQWGTLLTVSLDVAGFALDYRASTPELAGRHGLNRF